MSARSWVRWSLPVLLACGASTIAAAEEGSISPPSGAALVLDGTLAPEEWEGAARVEGEVELLFTTHEDALQIGVRVPGMLVASLCVLQDENVYVLHASAALGRASYVREQDGWELQEPFEWELRTTELNEAAQAERRAYLDDNGWVATTTRMGTPGEAEFRVSPDYLSDGGTRIALGVMVEGEDGVRILGWPLETGGDDVTSRELVGGPPPERARFEVGEWGAVE